MPIPIDTIGNSSFNGKTILSRNGFVCKICTQYTYINSLLMLYPLFRGPVLLKKSEPSDRGDGINTHTNTNNLCYLLIVKKRTPIVIILNHSLQVPPKHLKLNF